MPYFRFTNKKHFDEFDWQKTQFGSSPYPNLPKTNKKSCKHVLNINLYETTKINAVSEQSHEIGNYPAPLNPGPE